MKTTKQFLAGMGFATVLFSCFSIWIYKAFPEETGVMFGTFIAAKAEQSEKIIPSERDTVQSETDSVQIDSVESHETEKEEEHEEIIIAPEIGEVEGNLSYKDFCSVLGCLTKDEKMIKPSGKEYRLFQNYVADLLGMPKIWDKDIKKLKNSGYLVPIKDDTTYITIKKSELKAENAWVTIETNEVIDDVFHAFRLAKQKNLQLSSALRSVEYARKVAKENGNAVSENSMHSRGCTFDISYADSRNKSDTLLNLTNAEQKWLEDWFTKYIKTHRNVWMIKEGTGSHCYHVVVLTPHRIILPKVISLAPARDIFNLCRDIRVI